jgi:hypothetical protein
MFVGHGCSVLVVLPQPGDGGEDGSLRREPFTDTSGGVSSKMKPVGVRWGSLVPGEFCEGRAHLVLWEKGCSLVEWVFVFFCFLCLRSIGLQVWQREQIASQRMDHGKREYQQSL